MTEPRTVAAAIVGAFVFAIVLSFVFLRHKRKELALLVFVIALALVLTEVGLRLVHPTVPDDQRMFAYDRHLGWAFVPGKRGLIIYPGEARLHVETNSLGFRDREPAPDDAPKRRIMVLGDSFVSNISVDLDDVFTEVMERRLPDTAVLNCGVNGYGQTQEYLLLQQQLEALKPDLVVLLIYVRNDFDDNLGGHWLYPRPYLAWNAERGDFELKPPEAPREEKTRLPGVLGFYARSHAYRLFLNGVTLVLDRVRPDHRPSGYTPPELYLCRTDLSEDTRRMYAAMEHLLVRISDLAGAKGVPIVFAIAPALLQVDDVMWADALGRYGESPEDYRQSLPNDTLMAVAARHELAMLDLLPVLRAASAGGTMLYNPKEQHWNREGNRVVAEALLAYLEQRATTKAATNLEE